MSQRPGGFVGVAPSMLLRCTLWSGPDHAAHVPPGHWLSALHAAASLEPPTQLRYGDTRKPPWHWKQSLVPPQTPPGHSLLAGHDAPALEPPVQTKLLKVG